MKTPFWLDASALIESKDRWYPFSQVKKFWSCLSDEIERGSILAPYATYKELAAGNDELAKWVRTRRQALSVVPNECVSNQMTRIADFVQAKYKRNQCEEFLTGGDPWLVATAKCIGGTIVTGESRSRKQKIRIPTVCAAFGVKHVEIWSVVQHFDWDLS
jgi:hypothetical protein